jgi:hypothetical protein
MRPGISSRQCLAVSQPSPDRNVLPHGSDAEIGFISYDYGAYSRMSFLYFLGLSASGNSLPLGAWKAIERAMPRGFCELNAGTGPARLTLEPASQPVHRPVGNQV